MAWHLYCELEYLKGAEAARQKSRRLGRFGGPTSAPIVIFSLLMAFTLPVGGLHSLRWRDGPLMAPKPRSHSHVHPRRARTISCASLIPREPKPHEKIQAKVPSKVKDLSTADACWGPRCVARRRGGGLAVRPLCSPRNHSAHSTAPSAAAGA